MRNPLRLPETGEKRNEKQSFLKRAGKQLTAVALAFSAQYGGVLQAQPGAAAEYTRTTHMQQKAEEAPELAQLDKDYLLVDEAHTLKGGLVLMKGVPAVVFPVQDAKSGKRYIMSHEDGTLSGPEVPVMVKQLASIMESGEVKDIYPDSRQFMEFTQEQLDGIELTDHQKARIYYTRAFFWASMVHWKGEGKGRVAEGVAASGREQAFKEAETALLALDDGTPWFQERLKDLVVFKATLDATALHGATHSEKVTPRDIDTYSDRVDYVETVQKAAQIMQERTAAFLAGEKPKSEFMLDQALFARLAEFNLRYLKRLPEKSWMADQRYRDAMASVEAILPAFQEAFEAIGTGNDLQNLQQAREKVAHAAKLLGYQRILADSSYHFTGISAEELTTNVNSNFEVAQTLLDEHGPEKLYLSPESVQALQVERIAYAKIADNYVRLAAAGDTGKKLRALFAKVHEQGKWQDADKQAWEQIYAAAQISGSAEAQNELLAVLRENILISDPRVEVLPYEQTRLTQNYALSPINREIEGVVVTTTEHPVDTVLAEFEIDNRTPLSFSVDIVIRLPGADNAEIRKRIALQADKVAVVSYEGHISLASRDGSRPSPRAELQLAMRDVQEVAQIPAASEQLASAE